MHLRGLRSNPYFYALSLATAMLIGFNLGLMSHATPEYEPVVVGKGCIAGQLAVVPSMYSYPKGFICGRNVASEESGRKMLRELRKYIASGEIRKDLFLDKLESWAAPEYILFQMGWVCPDKQRIGPVGDQGRTLCGVGRLRQQTSCNVYVYGVLHSSIMSELESMGCVVSWRKNVQEAVHFQTHRGRDPVHALFLSFVEETPRFVEFQKQLDLTGAQQVSVVAYEAWQDPLPDVHLYLDSYVQRWHDLGLNLFLRENLGRGQRWSEWGWAVGNLNELLAADGHCPNPASQTFTMEMNAKRKAEMDSYYLERAALRSEVAGSGVVGLTNFAQWDIPGFQYFETPWNCRELVRVGDIGDGGKWICEPHVLKDTSQPCVIYSCGSNGQFDFEESMHEAYPHCEIHTFDPTYTPKPGEVAPYINYHLVGIGAEDGVMEGGFPIKTMASHMRDLGHTFVDVLKMDIERGEWKFLSQSKQLGLDMPFGLFLVEMHTAFNGQPDWSPTVEEMDLIWQYMESKGMRAYSRESNNLCSECWEYGFVNRDWETLRKAGAL